MSIKIGTVDPTSAIPSECLAAVGTSHQERQINVYVSEAGIELLAAPCVLSLEQACGLRNVLEAAIQVAARHKTWDPANPLPEVVVFRERVYCLDRIAGPKPDDVRVST